jgi:DNA-binding NarL/FixJ family response regulator
VRRSILIVDDQPDFRAAARMLLEAEGFDVVGEADDGQSAVTSAKRLHPEVVLLDIQLPDSDGFDVAEVLRQGTDPPVVILTSTRPASSYRRRLARSCALGFIAKNELSRETLTALGV